jgi:protein-L-isoaspartate O-methyltransferase
MLQIPIIAMTLTGGLWFGVLKLDEDRFVGPVLLLFTAAADTGLIIVILRIRFVIGEYLSSIRLFYVPGFVAANGSVWYAKPRVVIGVFSILLAIAVGLSLLGAVWLAWVQWTDKTLPGSKSHIGCVVRTYDKDAEKFLSQYESVTFEQVHRDIVDLIPNHPIRLLDIGAGSGRDAAALAQKGFEVTAVEPSDEFRAAAQKIHPDPNIKWIDDCLPNLSTIRAYDLKFGLILLSAVWMNIQPSERYTSFGAMADLLEPGGLLVVTLRQGQTDSARYIYAVSSNEIGDLAERFGLTIIRQTTSSDVLGRSDLTWTTVVLRKPS